MSNSTTKICKNCEKEKPLSEFYDHSGHRGKFGDCKECYKKKQYQRPPSSLDKFTSHVESENRLAKVLCTAGIPTLPGKALSHEYADLICWSCVFIEVKAARYENRQYRFSFTDEQRTRGLRGHIVVLNCIGNEETWHVFPANFPGFYHAGGTLKKAMSYTPDRRSGGKPSVLTDDVMKIARNRWTLINAFRDQAVSGLLSGKTMAEVLRTTPRSQPIIAQYPLL